MTGQYKTLLLVHTIINYILFPEVKTLSSCLLLYINFTNKDLNILLNKLPVSCKFTSCIIYSAYFFKWLV